VSLRILLESVLRHLDGRRIREEDAEALASWEPNAQGTAEIPFVAGRVMLQDFTGPCSWILPRCARRSSGAIMTSGECSPWYPSISSSITQCR
jgi:aconitase A